MNILTKQIVNYEGEAVRKEDQRWHLTRVVTGDEAILCTGEFVGYGASSGNGEEYIQKQVKRGGITCKLCMRIVLEMKRVKL